MLFRTAIIFPILYFLAVFQGSFMPHFSFFGFSPNIIFILIIFSIFLAPSLALTFSFAGGFFLDIFSSHFLGFHVLILLAVTFLLKLIFKKYVQVSFR